MKHTIIHHVTQYRALLVGVLIVFAGTIIVELVGDIRERWMFLLGAIATVIIGAWFGKKTAKHFHHHHHDGSGTTMMHSYDFLAVGVIFVANVLHPAVDGFSFYEAAAENGIVAGVIFGAGVVLHEILRQWGLIIAIRPRVTKAPLLVISTALIGIAVGIGFGLANNEFFHHHEEVADMATVFAYAFIVSEFYFSSHAKESKKHYTTAFLLSGLAAGVILSFFVKAH